MDFQFCLQLIIYVRQSRQKVDLTKILVQEILSQRLRIGDVGKPTTNNNVFVVFCFIFIFVPMCTKSEDLSGPENVGFSAAISVASGSPCRNRSGRMKSAPLIQDE